MIFLNITIPPAIRRFLLILPVVIAGFGIQNLYVYFTNAHPIEVSIEQLISNPPRAKWVRVTGGRINLIDSAASETGFKKKIESLYVPIHPEGKKEAAVSVLLLSKDPELLALARQFHSLDEAENGEVEGLKIAMENVRVILQNRPFEGLIQSGLFRDDRVIFRIRKTLPNIVREPIIIEEGKKPTIFEGLGILLLAGVAMVGVLSNPKPKVATPPPLLPTPPGLLSYCSFFQEPNLPLNKALESALGMLKTADLDPDRYTIDPGHGSRRNKRKLGRIYTAIEALEEIAKDDAEGFFVQAIRGDKEQVIFVMPPHLRSPFQSYGVSSALGLGIVQFHELTKVVSKLGNLGFAGATESNYMPWQRCDDPKFYERKYGPITDFKIIRVDMPAPLQAVEKLDISKNPGRISSVNKMPVFVAADMWLGPAFWKYAPCTKEEVLKEPWVEVEDTEHYLYLKAYPEPFTRPDGEQGRIQRRIWNVLFHQDCEWPPGSGTIAGA